jgi:hypothetical protein
MWFSNRKLTALFELPEVTGWQCPWRRHRFLADPPPSPLGTAQKKNG